MKSMKRVVVTGMGAITPIGNSVEEFWNGIKEQKIGFAPITYFDATELPQQKQSKMRDLILRKKIQQELVYLLDVELEAFR